MSNIKIYGQKSGKCLITVIKEGNNIYEPITDYISLNIDKIKQPGVILNNFNNTNEIYLDDKNTSYTLSVNNIKEKTTILYRIVQSFSYFQENQIVCLIDNDKIIPVNEGICIIEAILYESNNYLETKTNQIVLTIYKKDQQDLQTDDLIEIDYQKSIKLVTLGGDNDADEYEYSSSDSNICIIANDMLIARSVGRCLITAIKKGNSVFNDVKKTFQINVRRVNQTNLFFQDVTLNNNLFVQPNYGHRLNIINIQENAKVFYLVSDPNICIIQNGKLFALSEGKCQINTIVGETKNFLTTRTNAINITIVKNDQSELTILKSGELNFLSSISLSTIGGSADNEVVYTSKSDTIKIVNYMVFGIKYGLARITATIDGNKIYNPIKKEIEFIVNKINQPNFKMQNINESNTLYVNPDENHLLSTYNVLENAKVKFVIINNDNNICNISSNTLTANNMGTCLIQAIASETDNYLETVSEPLLLTVLKNDQNPLIIEYDKTINFMETKFVKVYGGSSSVAPVLSPLEFNSDCTIDGYQIYGRKAGICPILVKKDTDFMYNSIEETIIIEVLPILQQNITIADLNELNEIEVDPNMSFNLNINNINEDPKINYYIINENPVIAERKVCMFANTNKNSIIPLNNGTFDIKAVINMTDNYIQTETPLLNINVILKSADNYIVDKLQPLYFNSSINITVNNGIFTDEYEIISTEPNLIITDNKIFGKKVGSYSIIISKKATFMFTALNKRLRINVLKINQPNFNFIGLDTNIYVEPTIGKNLITTPVNENAVVKYIIVSEKPTNSNRVCNITNNMLYPYNEGTCIIKAITTETDNYLSTETTLITINIIKKNQNKLTITGIGELFYRSYTQIFIEGGSIDSTINFTTNNNNLNILLNKNTIEGLQAGITRIIITKKGNFMYNDISTTLSITVKKINEIVRLEDVNSENLLYNENNVRIPLIISGISENPNISFINLNPDICMISGMNLITLSEGRCVIKAKLSETQNYLETITNQITIDVVKRNDHNFAIVPSDILFINSTIFLKIASPNKKTEITITSNNNNVSIDGFNIRGISYGYSNLTIFQKGDDKYEDLITNYIIKINKIKQIIKLNNINENNMINVDDNKTYKLTVDNIQENANVTFNIISANVVNNQIPCVIRNSHIIPFSEGTCLIEAVIDETQNFDVSKSNQISINIFKNNSLIELNTQYTINFNSFIDLNKFGSDLIFNSSDNENCTNVNNILFGKKAGKYTITYFKSSDRLFFDLQKTFILLVKKINQTAIFVNINDNNTIYVNPTISIPLVVTGIQEKANVYFNLLNNENSICSIKNLNLIGLNSGTCTIEAYLTETTNYNATKLNSITLKIIKNDQVPISIIINNDLNYLSSTSVDILGGSTDIIPIFTSNDDKICKCINNTLIGVLAKTTTINAFKPGNFMYNDISTSYLIKINKIYQPNFTLNKINNLNTIYVNPDTHYILTTSIVKENAQVIYQVVNINSNEPICSINNNKLIPLLEGECYLEAISLENDNYLETKTRPVLLTIIKNQQSEINIKYPTSIDYNDSVYLELSGGNTINKINITIDSSCCIIDNNYELKGTFNGISNITFNKDGNFMYENISKSIIIRTNKILQKNISIEKLNETNEIDVDPNIKISLNVLNIFENPNIIYELVSNSSNDLDIIKIIDNKIIALNQGTVIIRAKCLETFNYLETITPDFNIIVNLKNAANFYVDRLPNLYYNSSIYLTINGLFDPKIYQIKSNNDNLQVINNKLIGLLAGFYTLTITKLETFEYKALSKDIRINVYKLSQPSFSIINSNINFLIDPSQKINIETSTIQENPNLNFKIISSISNSINPVCTINNKFLIPLNEGKVIVKAIALETDNYLETESSLITFTCSKNQQNPLNIELDEYLYVNKSLSLKISGGSTTNNIIYQFNNNNCYIDNNKIYGVHSGVTIINCTKKGDFMYLDVNYILKVTIYKIYQTLQLNNINLDNTLYAYSNNIANLRCDGIMESANIRYKILDSSANIPSGIQFIPDVCKIVSGNKILSLNEGTCSIQCITSETSNYLDTSSNILKINVIKNDINNISVLQSNILYINSSAELMVNSSTDMTDITILSNNSNCSISGNIVTGLIAGTSILNITKSENNSHKGFNTQFYIRINKLDQNVKIDNINQDNELFVNPNVPVNINLIGLADNASYKINIIESSENNICTISDNKLYVLESGYCILQADIFETSLYNSSITNQLTVNLKKNSEKIINSDIINSIYYQDNISLDILLGNNNNVILYEVNNDNCVVINNVLIAKNSGNSIIKAYFESTDTYAGNIKYYNIQIKKINQPNLKLNNINKNNELFVNPNSIYDLIIENINENAKFQYYISDLNICKLRNNSIIPINEGTCEIYILTYETNNYLSTKSNVIVINVKKNKQINFYITKSQELFFKGSTKILSSGGNTNSNVVYTSAYPNCQVLNDIVIGLSSGLCTINAFKDGNYMYEPINSTIDIIINKIKQPNFILNNINTLYIDINTLYVDPNLIIPLIVSSIEENALITFEIIKGDDIISINNGNIYTLNSGICSIKAIAHETLNYFETESNIININIIKKNQKNIDIIYPETIDYLSDNQLQVYGGNTDNPFIFTYSTNNCIIDENFNLKGLSCGNCNITIFKDGNFMYEPIQKTIFITIKKIKQKDVTIDLFNAINEIEINPNNRYNLNILNIKENSLIKYEIVKNSNLITINNNILVPLRIGIVTLKATLNETNNYLETITPEINITIISKSANNYFIDKLNKLFYKSSILLTINGGLFTNDYIIESLSDNISIENNVSTGFKNILTGLKAGDCNIKIKNKITKISKELKITVNKIDQPIIQMIDLNYKPFVNSNDFILLKTNNLLELSKPEYIIVNNNGTDGRLVNLNENKFYPINSGNFKFYISTSETDNYNSTKSNIFTVNIIKNNQSELIIKDIDTVTINSITNLIVTGGTTNNNIIFKTNNNSCYIQSNKLYAINSATCKITAIRLGNNKYNDVSKTIDVIIKKIYQTVKLLDINNNTLTVNPFIENNLYIDGIKEDANIAYNIVDIIGNQVCYINENKKLIALNEGKCSIEGLLFETNNYLPTKTNKIIISVLPLPQNTLLVKTSDVLYYKKSVNLLTYGGSISGDITITTDSSKCDISGLQITGLEYGLCNLIITNEGDNQIKPITTNLEIQVNKIDQDIELLNINDLDQLIVNDEVYLNVVNIQENAQIEFIINQPINPICYINDNKLVAIKAGVCTIQAITNETNNYLSTKSNIINLTIIKKNDILLNLSNINEIDYQEIINLKELDISNNLDIEYISNNSNCKIESNMLTGLHSGTSIIYAIKKGNSIYGDIKAEFNININKIYQENLIIKNFNDTNTLFINPYKKHDIILLNIKENVKYNYYLSNNNVCYIVNDKLIVNNLGKCDIYFETTESDNYLSTKSNTITIISVKNNQIKFIINQLPSILNYKSSIKLYIDGGSTDSNIVLEPDNNNCQIINDKIIGLKCGTTKINIFKSGNFMYNDISDYYIIRIEKIYQSNFKLSDLNYSNIIFVNPYIPIKLETTDVNENANIIYKIKYLFTNEKSSIISINNNLLYANFSGKCTITAISLETENYLETESNTITLNIIKNNQSNLIINCPTQISLNSSTYLETSGGSTDNKILFSINNNCCIIDKNNQLIGKNIGSSTITVTKKGNDMYNSISKTITVQVNKINQQNIIIENFNELNELLLDSISSYKLNVLNVQENPRITYQIINSVPDNSNSIVCELNDNLIKPINSGYVIIKAICNETTNYILTETPILKINIILNNPSNFIIDKIPQLFYNSTTKITLNNNNFNINNYEFSTTSTNISINSNIITGLLVGKANIIITKKETPTNQKFIKQIEIFVNKINQPNFEIIDLSNNIFVNPSNQIKLNTTNTLENATITFRVISSNIIDSNKAYLLSGNILSTLNTGLIILQASTSATTNYNATTSPNLIINIIKNEQAPIIINASNILIKEQIIPISIDGGNNLDKIKYITNNDNCFILNNNIYGVYAGKTIITAIKSGNFMYNDIKTNLEITIQKIKQNPILLDINQYNNIVYANNLISYDLILNNLKEKGPITFINKSENNICIINNNKIIATTPGICIIQAIIEETDNYQKSTSNEITITINSLPINDISIHFLPLFYNESTNISILNNNNISMISESNKCTINNNLIYGNSVGKLLVKITKPIEKIFEIKVNKIYQSLLLNPISDDNNIYINKNYTLELEGVQEKPDISFESSDINICYVLENILYPIKEGTVTIIANTSETNNYLETSSNKLTINILKQVESLNLNLDINSKLTLSPFDISNNTINNTIEYNIINDISNCQIINNDVIGLKAGYCTINAILGEETKKYSIIINKISQPTITISLNDYNNFYYINPDIGHVISISNLNENPNTYYTITNNKICKIINNILYVLNEGSTTIYLYTQETDNYLSTKSNILFLKFIKNNQTNIKILESSTLYYNSFNILNIDGGSINSKFNITSDSSNCRILEDSIIGLNSGICKINVIKEGNFMYNPISSNINIFVNKIKQPEFKIFDINTNNNIFINEFKSYKLSISETFENPIILLKLINYNSNNDNIINIDGLNIYGNLEGTCSVIAITKETTNYIESYSKPLIITVSKNNQDPLIINWSESINYNEKIYIQTSGGNTDQNVTFNLSNNVCTINENNEILGNNVGTCTITATKNGNNNYLPINKIFTIKVNKILQDNISIVKFNELNEIIIDPNINYTLNILNANENPNIRYIITNSSVNNIISLNNNTFIANKEGTCTIKAILSPTTNYLETTTPTIDIIIIKKTLENFTIDTLPVINYNSSFKITVNNGYYNNNEFSIIPEKTDAFTINENILIPLITGYQNINIIKKSINSSNELSKTITVKIMKIKQPSFDIIDLSNNLFINLENSYILKTTTVNESSNITFNILSNNNFVCNIINNYIYATNVGSCLIQASTSETSNYLSTLSPVFKINCYKNNQKSLKIDRINYINKLYYNSFISLSVLGGSTKYPIQIISNDNKTRINNNIIYGLSAGNTSVTLFKHGDNIFNDLKISYDLIIYKIEQNITLININDTNQLEQNNYYKLNLIGIQDNAKYKFNIINTFSNSADNNDNICYFLDDILYTTDPGMVIIEAETFETNNYLPSKSNTIIITVLPLNKSDTLIIPSGPLYYNSFITIDIFNNILDDINNLNSPNSSLPNSSSPDSSSPDSSSSSSSSSPNSRFIIKSDNNNCLIIDNKIYGKKVGKSILTVEKPIFKSYIINIQKIFQEPKIEILNITNNIIYINSIQEYYIQVSNVYENPKIEYQLIDNYNNCCNLIDNKLITNNEGYIILNALISETNNYLKTITSNIKIIVLKQNQKDIILDQIININYNASIMLNTDTSFTYTISGQNCTINNGLLTSKKAGTDSLIITKDRDIKNISIQINKILQDQLLLDNINVNNTIFINPNIKYRLPIKNIKENASYTFNISDTNICNITDNFIYGLNEGYCNIYFITNETTNFLSTQSNILTIHVIKNDQANLDIILDRNLNYKSFCNIYVNGGSNLENVIFTLNNNNADISNNTDISNNNIIIGIQSGICELTATKPSNYMYNKISTSIIFEVYKIFQNNFTLYNINNTNIIFVDPDNGIELITSNIEENATITFIIESISQNNININDNKLYANNEGEYFITAITTETNNYLITRSNKIKITIVKQNQDPLNIDYSINLNYNEIGYISIKGGNTDNNCILRSNNNNLKIDGYKISGPVGQYTITIFKDGDFRYLPTSKNININIIPIYQTILLENINETNEIIINQNNPYTLNISNIQENANYNLIIVKNSVKDVCIIENNKIIPKNIGTCTIKAVITKTLNYLSTESNEIKINVILNDPLQFYIDTLPKLNFNSSVDLKINNTFNSELFKIKSNNNNILINNNRITGIVSGKYNIDIIRLKTTTTNELIKNIDLIINKINQPNFIIDISNNYFVNPNKPLDIKLPQVQENAKIIFELILNNPIGEYNNDVCRIINNDIYALNKGYCIIKITAQETKNYNETETTILLNIKRNIQNNLNLFIENKLIINSFLFINYTGGSTTNLIKYTSNNSNISIKNGKIYGISSGSSKITAYLKGNEIYENISSEISISVYKKIKMYNYIQLILII